MDLEKRLEQGITVLSPETDVFVGFELTHGELTRLCASVDPQGNKEVARVLAALTPKETYEDNLVVACRKSDIELLYAHQTKPTETISKFE